MAMDTALTQSNVSLMSVSLRHTPRQRCALKIPGRLQKRFFGQSHHSRQQVALAYEILRVTHKMSVNIDIRRLADGVLL